MGEICGFSLEFVIKGKSTKRNRVEMDDKVLRVFLCYHHMGVDMKTLYDKHISVSFALFFFR